MLSAHLRFKTLASGTNIMIAEQPGEVIYMILSGTIKIHIEQQPEQHSAIERSCNPDSFAAPASGE